MKNTTIRKISASALISTVLLLSVMAKADDSPSAKIILSPETTRITEPLNDDGTVNYLAALNEQYSKGVTAENNAAILFLQAAGPKILAPAIKNKVLAILGLSSLPSEGDYFIGSREYALNPKEIDQALQEALDGPWSAKDYPKLADWLKANEKPLSLVISATNRPRYYMPMLSPDEPPRMYSGLVLGLQIKREMARVLVVGAMLKLDSGDIDGAKAELLAVHRLARLVGQGPTLIDRLLGMAVESEACRGDNGLATSGRLSSSQAQTYLATLQGLTALPSVAESIDKCERFSGLAGVMLCHREGFEALLGLMVGTKTKKHEQVAQNQFDWNEVLRIVNSWYDRLVEAASKETFRERQEAFERISTELKETTANLRRGQALAPPKTTEEMGNLLVSLLVPSVERASAQHNLTTMMLRVSQVAMALAGYRAEVGSYPESLDKLCPKYFKTVPVDLFTAKPVDYRRVKNGYVLYSAGPDANKDYDDIVVQTSGSVNE